GVYCCDVIDITDGDQYTDEVEDGVGEVPQNIIDAGYADDVDDWDGFYDYKCMISHVMIDNMTAQTQKISSIIDESGAALVTVAVIASIAATILTAGGYLLVAGILLGVASAAGLYAAFSEVGEAGLPNLLDAMDEHHDELACTIYQADGSQDAVDALKDKIDELFNVVQATYLKSLNLQAQLKALYAGRYDQQDIAQEMADNDYDPVNYDCTCEVPTTPTDLDIAAWSWDVVMTGDALTYGIGESTLIALRTGARFPTPTSREIIRATYQGGPTPGAALVKT
ncbi:unnamed protein product, partial [marine sediment metagenome]